MILFLDAQGGISPESWHRTTIVVFLKKGKSELSPSSYRPISLINSDSKIFSKIIAQRLGTVISALVSNFQHGFIPGRDTSDHVRRVISFLDWAQATGSALGVILLDAEKAFDRVPWPCMWEVLRLKGFCPEFCQTVRTLYERPVATVRISGQESGIFNINRGTRQGCPCSPLLF